MYDLLVDTRRYRAEIKELIRRNAFIVEACELQAFHMPYR